MVELTQLRIAALCTALLGIGLAVQAQTTPPGRDLRLVPDMSRLSAEEATTYLNDVRRLSRAEWRALPQDARCGHLANSERYALGLVDNYRARYQQALDHMNSNPDMSPEDRRSAEFPARTIRSADMDVVEAAKQLAKSMGKPGADYASALVLFKTAEVFAVSSADESRSGLRDEGCPAK